MEKNCTQIGVKIFFKVIIWEFDTFVCNPYELGQICLKKTHARNTNKIYENFPLKDFPAINEGF